MRNLHTNSATIEKLVTEAEIYGISLIVLLATYFPHKKSGVHNMDMLERIKGHPLFIMFGSLDVMNNLEEGFLELEHLASKNLISGIKLYPGYQSFEPSESRLACIYELADKYNLPVMLHGGELHHCEESLNELSRPKYIEKPALSYPKVKFIVSHLSNPHFAELRDVMTRCPNIHTDISGQFVSGSAEDTEEYREVIVSEIRQFLMLPNGHDRVMFATDFPIQSYKDSLDLVTQLRLDSDNLDKMLYKNALRILDKKPHQ